MKTLLLFLIIVSMFILKATAIYGQCWDEILVKQHDGSCFGGNNGSVTGYYRASKPLHGKKVIMEFYKEIQHNYRLQSMNQVTLNGEIYFPNLEPGKYKLLIFQYDLENNYLCHSEIFPTIYEPGCDLNIDYTDLNTDASSEDFLILKTQFDGSFCNFGYERNMVLAVNGHEYHLGISIKDSSYNDHIVYNPVHHYVLPGDEFFIYIDNANGHPVNNPSSLTCRSYSSTISLECDLAIDSLSVIPTPGGYIIKGILKTKYLKLKSNYLYHRYASDFFKINVHDTAGHLITSHFVRDTAGLFSMYLFDWQINDQEDFLLKWKLGNCYFELPFNVNDISTATTKYERNNTKLYPNPVRDLMKLTIDPYLTGSPFLISDQSGKTIMSGELLSETSTINVGKLPDGVYYLNLSKERNKNHKFIKISH